MELFQIFRQKLMFVRGAVVLGPSGTMSAPEGMSVEQHPIHRSCDKARQGNDGRKNVFQLDGSGSVLVISTEIHCGQLRQCAVLERIIQ